MSWQPVTWLIHKLSSNQGQNAKLNLEENPNRWNAECPECWIVLTLEGCRTEVDEYKITITNYSRPM